MMGLVKGQEIKEGFSVLFDPVVHRRQALVRFHILALVRCLFAFRDKHIRCRKNYFVVQDYCDHCSRLFCRAVPACRVDIGWLLRAQILQHQNLRLRSVVGDETAFLQRGFWRKVARFLIRRPGPTQRFARSLK